MARIILGVQGEGMGHAIRTSILLKQWRGEHKVKVFAGNRAYKFLSKHFTDVNEIQSQNMVYKNNKIKILPTVWLFIKNIPKYIRDIKRVRKAIKDFKADIVISDFELITNYAPWFTGCRHVQCNNQNDIVWRTAKPKFSELFSFINTRIITMWFSSGAHKYMIYSIDDKEDKGNRVYLGNLIEEEIQKQKAKYGKHIFVYQTSKSNDKMIEVLKSSKEQFIVYGFDEEKKDENITFRKFNNDIFYKDLCGAKAVFVNGGLTTITEAIYLKKPILCVPVGGQFEQYFNAQTVERMGFGMHLKELSKKDLDKFMKNQSKYIKNLERYKCMSNKEIFAKIEKVIRG